MHSSISMRAKSKLISCFLLFTLSKKSNNSVLYRSMGDKLNLHCNFESTINFIFGKNCSAVRYNVVLFVLKQNCNITL